MQDKKEIFYKILNNKNFNIKVSEPFSKLAIEFLDDFSKTLRKKKKVNLFPDLIYLIFWCRRKKIEEFAKNLNNKNIRLGRGLLFHVCPSNVPTNFIYSFFFGLLSGNSNIVKMPSKNFEEKKIIISVINFLFKKKKYNVFKDSNSFIQYESDSEKTKQISSICDGRILWGGDQTINEIRKIWIPERSVELTFPDRYSISIINLKYLSKIASKERCLLAKRFYYDGYTMNQSACNSPHFVFFIGKKNLKIQNFFWNELNKFVQSKFIFDDIHIIDKYSNLIENIISQDSFKNLKTFKNNVYVVEPNEKTNSIENIRGKNGIFFQKNISKLENLKKYITKKCQTVSYFGFEKKQLKNFITKSNLKGIDRFVPIGQALEINFFWDGYEVINSLSRVVSLD